MTTREGASKPRYKSASLTYSRTDPKTGETVLHPLVEAEYTTAFTIYKSDRKRAIRLDPEKCIEALGMCKMPGVAFAHIGSGRNAYVGYYDANSPTGIVVRHFFIPAAARKARDVFETKGSPKTQILLLKRPSKGNHLVHRSAMNKARRVAVKNGAPVKHRGPKKRTRVLAIPGGERFTSVGHRRSPTIKGGNMTLEMGSQS